MRSTAPSGSWAPEATNEHLRSKCDRQRHPAHGRRRRPMSHQGPPLNYINVATTTMSWLNTRDHKRVGVMFLFFVTLSLFLGGAFALILRAELLTPDRTILSAQAYNRLFTLHGIVMIFLFLVPAIPSAFGNFILPLMLGAKDVAFPRLNLGSLYCYLVGAVITLWGMIHGGTDTGWTF